MSQSKKQLVANLTGAKECVTSALEAARVNLNALPDAHQLQPHYEKIIGIRSLQIEALVDVIKLLSTPSKKEESSKKAEPQKPLPKATAKKGSKKS